MSEQPNSEPSTPKSEFEELRDGKQLSLAQEFLIFLKENKNWWLLPILIVLSVVALLGVLGSTGVAPFIYTLF